MIDTSAITELLEKPMGRKDFLKHIGGIMVGLVGVGAFIRNLTNPLHVKKKPKKVTKNTGYGGGGAYGVQAVQITLINLIPNYSKYYSRYVFQILVQLGQLEFRSCSTRGTY